MKKRSVWIGILALVILACVCLAGLMIWAIYPRRAASPSIKILFPQPGMQVAMKALVPIKVEANITSGKLRRIQLFADSQLIGNIPVRSESSNALWVWNALTPGIHTLMAQAITDKGTSARDSVRIEVTEAPDSDGDGIVDESDRCPNQPGILIQEGCPSTSDTDHDGDSVADNVDRCLDLFGLVENDGCPTALDSDGDGIPDNKDRCTDAPGPAPSDGCPDITSADRDGDGILDSNDLCPDESGTLDSGGCPPVVSGDRDGDGVLDASNAIKLPITRIAAEATGKSITANVVSLGILVGLTGIVSRESINKAIIARAPKGTEELNQKALERGFAEAQAILAVKEKA